MSKSSHKKTLIPRKKVLKHQHLDHCLCCWVQRHPSLVLLGSLASLFLIFEQFPEKDSQSVTSVGIENSPLEVRWLSGYMGVPSILDKWKH